MSFVDKSSVDLVPRSEFLVDSAYVSGALLSDYICVPRAIISVLELTAVLATLIWESTWDRWEIDIPRSFARASCLDFSIEAGERMASSFFSLTC